MGRYLLIWKLDSDRIPEDPKERAAGWGGLLNLVKKDFEKGMTKDWGTFVGEGKGYCIVEGSETEIAILMQQYSPYVQFETHPIMSVSQAEDMLNALSK